MKMLAKVKAFLHETIAKLYSCPIMFELGLFKMSYVFLG